MEVADDRAEVFGCGIRGKRRRMRVSDADGEALIGGFLRLTWLYIR